MVRFIKDQHFWIVVVVVLGLKLAIIGLVVPQSVSDWYLPFLKLTTAVLTYDPWALWIESGGDLEAYPYGYVTWLYFSPFYLIAGFFGLPDHIAYGLAVLTIDLLFFWIFTKYIPIQRLSVIYLYWASPIILLGSYWLGFNDLLPIFLFFLALVSLKAQRLFFSGVFAILAVSAKLSMIVGLPLLMIYVIRSKKNRPHTFNFFVGLTISFFLIVVPYLSSDAAVAMLISNSELYSVYRIGVSIGQNQFIYIIPLLYCLLLYATWRIKRMNFELFVSMAGFSFFLIVLGSPSAPGWFIWLVPFLVVYQGSDDKTTFLLGILFSLIYAIRILIGDSGYFSVVTPVPSISSMLLTGLFAVAILIVLRTWRDTIARNDFFRLSRKPFVMGIAGDSGSGKDTLADAVAGLFGEHSVSRISGDDYHFWDRQKPIWGAITHLNPISNDLKQFSYDLLGLIDGRKVSRGHYAHDVGVRSAARKIAPNDVILASGLHVLYLPMTRDLLDLKIFLDMDEELRRFLKIMRDTRERGHPEEKVLKTIQSRTFDSEKYIAPQEKHADLSLSLQPISKSLLESAEYLDRLRLKLLVKSRNSLSEESLRRVLVGICGLQVDLHISDDSSEVHLLIEGDVNGEDIALASKQVCPKMIQFLDLSPKWEDGALGIMQLVILAHVEQMLLRRLL